MKRTLLAMFLCCVAAPAFADDVPQQVPAQFVMFQGAESGSCLQSPADPAAFDYRLQQAQCSTVDASQMLVFELDPKGGYRIRNTQSDACVDALTFAAPGDAVVQLPCNGQDNQRWDLNYSEGNPNTAMMRNILSGHCLAFADGIAVQAACDITNGTGPFWVLNRQPGREPGGAQALQAVVNSKCLTIDAEPVSGTCANDGRTNLRFSPLDDKGTTFSFDGRIDGTCLMQQGNAVAFGDCITGTIAHWRLIETSWEAPAPNGEKRVRWQVQNVGSGECLHADRGSVTPDGVTVTMLACDASDNAQWRFQRY